jgi:hypothetical protein
VREVGGSGISRPWKFHSSYVRKFHSSRASPRERARAPADGKIRPRRAQAEPG